MVSTSYIRIGLSVALLLLAATVAEAKQSWTQLKFDSRRSGDVPDRSVTTPLGLLGAVPLTDAVFTAPVLADGRVYVVDGSGVAFCLDADTMDVIWRFASAGGKANCNNVSSPAIVAGKLHFGTMAGDYYVLDAATGAVVRRIECGDPIFGSPVVGHQRVYFATLGSRVHAVKPDGTPCWVWDFVRQRLGFTADRWDGQDWLEARGREAGWREQFCCTRSPALVGDTLVVPAGGTLCWLEDQRDRAELRGTYCGKREAPATLGLSIDRTGAVYRQWTRRDNGGNVEILRLGTDGKVAAGYVRGTETSYRGAGLLSFCSVSLRGRDVYRCRPQIGFGLCRHTPGGKTHALGGFPSIAAPILLKNTAVYGGLDGKLYVVPLDGDEEVWSFATAFGSAISAPVAVCDGRVYFGCEDGYLYALGPNAAAELPSRNLALHEIQSPLEVNGADAQRDWFTSFGNLANTNTIRQEIKPPFRLKWIRRYEGTVKHFSVCGGGRMFTHTAEGQIFAVEQQTGRLLWRRYFPGVHVSYTSPLYHQGRLYVPQAGLEKCRLRCLDAATGKLLWEAPFSGSPSWNRQLPPIPYKGLVIYQFSSGNFTPKGWLFEHQSTFGFPQDHRPLVRAYDARSGKQVWTRDFSEYGAGGDDAGMCLMDDTLYYSCYFGDKDPSGVTAAIEPESGRVLWTTTKHSVHAGCTVSGDAGRLYLGGYNPVEGKVNRVWCLDGRDGSLIWKSEPISRAIHTITVGSRFLFTHSQYNNGYLIDKRNGKILSTLVKGYRCTRFTLCEPYLLGPNLSVFDLAGDNQPIYGGPAIDVLVCIGMFASNGRLFYTTNGAGLQASLVWGAEAASEAAPWHDRLPRGR